MEKQGAHNTPRSQSHHGGGGREDCWSEGATETLVEAWGSRYLRLNRGNLRQRDWKEVADAVNARQNGVKPRKTDIQCKNRIDTLKKKYKLEKAKPPPSKWPFYSRLNSLIGTNAASTAPSKKPTTGVTFTVKHSKQFLNPNPSPSPNFAVYSNASSSKSKLNSAGSTESSYGGGTDDNDNDNYDDEYEEDDEPLSLKLRKNRMYSVDLSDDAACRELARAILKFGEIYERIESSKQQKIMELERQRMEYTRDLESQRMNMFMEAQLELQKIKRPKHAPGSGKKL